MSSVDKVLLIFVSLYPVVAAGLWIAGGILYHVLDEPITRRSRMPGGRALRP